MSDTIRMISPCIQSLQRRKSHYDSFLSSFAHQFSDSKRKFSLGNLVISPKKTHEIRAQMTPETAWGVEDSLQNIDSPVSIDLQPINSEGQFDRFIAEAQQLEESVIVVWIASWCRKCIYLKPKLEKLAADYYPGIRFYCVDVNTVPHRLVVRAGITKMPTIQLWKDSKKQAEVIGGHKAYLVVNEVREMIENEYSV